jgi:hypothetical protein
VQPSQRLRAPVSVGDSFNEDNRTRTPDVTDSQIQAERNRLSSGFLNDTTRSRKLYWYDADRYRAGTYVPLSSAKGQHDENLMLYRPARPWDWLGTELTRLLEKEAQWAGARAKRIMPITASVDSTGRKRLGVQKSLQSLTALALQRRQVNSSRTRNQLSQIDLFNLSTKK